MSGLAPLSWGCLDAWARRTGRDPSPEECDALMQLDSALFLVAQETRPKKKPEGKKRG